MVKWTPEQQQAIDESGSDILVAAAAGSGKTAVLVERIIGKLMSQDDPYHIDEILVATFTNAAAEEMRSRIGSALEQAITLHPNSYHLKKQLSLLQRASISTLHAFCTSVVRQYAYMIDVDPAFRIADEMEMDLIRQEVLDHVLEEAYSLQGKELSNFYRIVDMFSNDRNDVDLGNVIMKLYQFAMESPWPEKWLEEVVKAYALPENCTESDLPWLTELKADIKVELVGFQVDINRAIDIARESDGPYHYLEALEEDMKLIEEAICHVDNWEGLQNIFQSSKLKNLSRKKVECNEDKKDAIKIIRKNFRDDWNKMKQGWFSRSLKGHIADMHVLHPIVSGLADLVIQFKEEFTTVKREEAIVDFSDLEHFCLQILIDPASTTEKIIPSQVANAYKKQFREILVDEYQDINIVQETILSAVSDQDGQGNMFMVGDVKQSIYRFRHAEPTLFIRKYKEFASNDSDGQRIDLARNFRSRQDVLSGANFIFKQIFDESLGDIAYDRDAELQFGNLGYNDFPLENKETELILVDRDTKEATHEEEQGESVEDLMNTQLEARVYIQKIKEWIGDETHPPLQVIDKTTNKRRDIKYRDIVILLRSLTGVSTIMDELKKQGIPVYAELRTGYLVAIEIQVMLNLLKIIDNPYQDIPLASVLRSPIVGLNEEDLAQIRLTKKGVSFYEAVQLYVKAGGNQELSLFLTQLTRFRKIAREDSLSKLIWQIYQETGYYDFVGGIPGGRQRQANLRALYDRARGYETTSFRGLFRFLRFIERMQEEKKDLGEARALSEQEDVVRIMTIHKSKGLEFPVVIIGGMNKQFNFQDLRTKYMLDKDLGFATKFIDPEKRLTYPTLYYIALQQASLQKLLSEEMRVLYVAMTRAKEKLVMIGNVASVEKLKENWSVLLDHNEWVLPTKQRKKAKSYLDWVGPALIRHRENNILHAESVDMPDIKEDIVQDSSNWKVMIKQADELINLENYQEKINQNLKEIIMNWDHSSMEDKGNYDHVDAILSYEYPYMEATKTNVKQSVTEIKRRRETHDTYSGQTFIKPYAAPLVKRPRFMQEETVLHAAEIGTAMHTVMQHINFNKSYEENELKLDVEKLVSKELLTESEASEINLTAILRFLKGDMAKIITESAKIEREIPFTYTLAADEIYPDWQSAEVDKAFIQGVVDCLIHQDDGLIILDYKTDHINEDVPTEGTINKLKERYRVQLSLYSKAIEDIMQKKVKSTYLYFFDKDLLIKV